MKKTTLKAILACIAVAILLAAAIVTANAIERKSEKAPEGAGTIVSTVREGESEEAAPDYDAPARETVNINGKDYYPNENLRTLLIMGIDDMELTEYEGSQNEALADFLALAIFDEEQKTCTLLQINRNTMTDMQMLGALGDVVGLVKGQIALAHSYGSGLNDSCENTVDAVSRLLYGVHIDNYLSLNMGAITTLNDTVGGVTVTIEDDFSGADDTLVKGQTVTLMGEHAFHYVHDRFQLTDDANASRMRRQATYMTALAAKLREKTETEDGFVLELYNAVADYLLTDCDINELSDYSESLGEYTLADIVTPEGRTVTPQDEDFTGDFTEFYPDEEKLQQLVADLFYVPADGQ